MERCFVMQPFDDGKFDKRYDDVFEPAIVDAKLEPYRVDRDPGVSIPIEEIEVGILNSRICLAEITTDNPNVWFELGFAIASKKEVVLVCSKERQSRFPFDIQHRSILEYKTEAPQDFSDLKTKITQKLKALMKKEATVEQVAASSIRELRGLKQHEFAALITIGENVEDPHDTVLVQNIHRDMEKAGFTKIATTLALAGLQEKKLVTLFVE